MKKQLLYASWLPLLLLFLFPQQSRATHIVGGEITYQCLGGQNYRINLTIFRDCDTGVPWFDDPASIGIFDINGNYVDDITVFWNSSSNDTLAPILSDPCLAVPPNVCIHSTTYTAVTSLPFIVGGYQLAYQRCCRNQDIVNIIAPLSTGATYYTYISEQALLGCNNSAVFNSWPPVYICKDYPILFDHSATDADGDSIVYELCTPLTGASEANPMPQPPNPPPYFPVNWSAGHALNNMLGNATDPLAINAQTGLLTGTPNTLGVYVVGICAKEYRAGVLISTTRRDFQYAIGVCGYVISSAFLVPDQDCSDNLTVVFGNQSNSLSQTFFWNFDTTDVSATSNFKFPTYTYPDTGYYTVMLIADPGHPCTDTSYQTIHVQRQGVSVTTANITLCSGDTAVLRALSPEDIAQGEQLFYNWSPATNVIGATTNDSLVVLATGNSTQYYVTVTNQFGCTDVASASVIRRSIDADFEIQIEPCNTNLTVDFQNQSTGGQGASYYWNFDTTDVSLNSTASNPRYTYSQTGVYTAMLVMQLDTFCVDTIYQTFDLQLRAINVNANDTIMCSFGAVTLRALCPDDIAQGETITYQWSPANQILNGANADTAVVWINQDASFQVAVQNQYGCRDSVTVHVDRQTVIAEFPLPVDKCYDGLTVPFNNGSRGEINTYLWYFDTTNTSATSTAFSPTYTYPDTGTYIAMLIAAPGEICSDTFYRTIELKGYGIEVFADPIQFVCRWDTAVLKAVCPNNLSDTIVYRWTPATFALNPTNQDSLVVWANQNMNYMVWVENQHGCTDSAYTGVNITYFTPPIDATADPDSIFKGQQSQLQTWTSGNGITYSWQYHSSLSDTAIADPTARPDETTTYYITVTDVNGCYNADSVTVYLKEPICGNPLVFLPNAFTPNADGLNDVLYVRGVNINQLYFVVYDRWGEQVFQTTDLNIGWDGTFRGKQLPPDAYGYYFRCRCDNGEEYFEKGNVSLLR